MGLVSEARFIRRIFSLSNAIETTDNEIICFIIFCLNCIRHDRNATYEPGLNGFICVCLAVLMFSKAKNVSICLCGFIND